MLRDNFVDRQMDRRVLKTPAALISYPNADVLISSAFCGHSAAQVGKVLNFLDGVLLDGEQAGFRQERSTTDQIATLRNIIEQSLEWNTTLYNIFVDFEKALDIVDRDTLWKLLAYYGIPEKIIKLIRMAFQPSTCQVVHNGSLTEPFTITTGVRQGCLLSPFFLLLLIGSCARPQKIRREDCSGH